MPERPNHHPPRRALSVCLLLASLLLPLQLAAPASAAEADGAVGTASLQQSFNSRVQPFLEQNCYRCHANGKKKGDFSLDGFKSLSDVQNDRRTWATVVDVLRQKVMPPEDRPQPAPADVSAVTDWIGDALTHCDCSGPRDPGRVAIHRLNRAEYNNTIRDLLAIDFHPADDFPADDTGYGFDNIADVLSMSPLLAEKYLSAAEQALDKAVSLDNPLANKTRHFDCAGMDATGGNAGGELGKNGECYANIDFVADAALRVPHPGRAGQVRQRAGPDDLQARRPAGRDVRRGSRPRPHPRLPAEDGRQGRPAQGRHRVHQQQGRSTTTPTPRSAATATCTSSPGTSPAPSTCPPRRRRRVTSGSSSRSRATGSREEACARELIRRFATRAFRRPATDDEADGLMKLYRLSREQGDAFEQAVKLALTGVLVSPHFLFRIEIDPPVEPGAPKNSAPAHLVTDYELATRLSYFLWSSMPDEELFDLAAAGQAPPARRDRGPGPADAPGPRGAGAW